METQRKQVYFVATVLAATLAGGAYFAYRNRAPSAQRVAERIETWPAGPRTTAALMMDRYGLPNALTPVSATWYERGPWKRIVVRSDAPDNYLEQAVSYRVPTLAVMPIAQFGSGVRADTAHNELIASSNEESLNHLALNLTDDIATGKLTAEEARKIYVDTANLASAGKTLPYTQKLLFAPHRPIPEDAWRRQIGY